jgi:hypothetical protein
MKHYQLPHHHHPRTTYIDSNDEILNNIISVVTGAKTRNYSMNIIAITLQRRVPHPISMLTGAGEEGGEVSAQI